MLTFVCDYGGEKYTKEVKSTLKGLSYMDDEGIKHEVDSEDSPCFICESAAEAAKKQALENRRVKKI